MSSTLSTHVLDTATGTPAAGVPIRLETRAGEHLVGLEHDGPVGGGRLVVRRDGADPPIRDAHADGHLGAPDDRAPGAEDQVSGQRQLPR